jgi:hypothetical protein
MRSWVVLCCLAAAPMLGIGACVSESEGVATAQGGRSGGSGGGKGGSSSSGSSIAGQSGSGGTGSASGGTTSSGGISSGGTVSTGGSSSATGGTGSGGASARGGTIGAGGSSFATGGTGSGGTSARGGSGGGGGVTAKGGMSTTGGIGSGGTIGTGGTTSTSTLAKFSFFVISYAAIQKIAGNAKGLGGDLRHGETGAGAGLRGADKICTEIAEGSMVGAGAKKWRAFLSATADENGKQVNAIERIGSGPWYDRLGRLFANNTSELYYDRPQKADAAIKNDFPNENGVPNQNPDKTGKVDNHDMLTGTNDQGKLYSATATCSDWTSSTATSGQQPRVGHSWPTMAEQCSTTSTLGGGAGGSGGGFPGIGGMGSMCNWMSALDESGCAPGVNLIQNGGPGKDGTVGSGGGYGGFYCFALTP